jgi:hypothetical protein
MRTVVVGSHESELTRGLPRIADYTLARAAVRAEVGLQGAHPLIEITL